MIIILDGPDGSGKTTLAKKIIELHGKHKCRYLHITRRKQQFMWYYTSLKNACKWVSEGYLVIIDRSWTSECIYSKVYHQNERPQYDHLVRMIHRISLSLKALNVLCIPYEWDAGVYSKLCESRNEMYANKMESIYGLYKDLYYGYNWRGFPFHILPSALNLSGDSYVDYLSVNGVEDKDDFVLYDMQNSNDADVEYIIDYAFELQTIKQSMIFDKAFDLSSSNPPYEFARYSGNISKCKYLFLGNPQSEFRQSMWPMVSIENAENTSIGTVEFINECFHKMKVSEYSMCFLNFDRENAIDDDTYDFIKQAKKIIVLGCSKSAEYLHRNDCSYSYLPMPKEIDTYENYCLLIANAIR